MPLSRRALRAVALLHLLVLTAPAEAGRDFVATEQDFQCLTLGHKVPGKNFFIQTRAALRGKSKRTLRRAAKITASALASGKTGFRYPVGTILQLFPFEAMVKRRRGFNPAGGDWEYFQLDVSSAGTVIKARGTAEVANAAGSCQGCHQRLAERHDFVCEYVIGTSGLGLTDTQVAAIQAADPRCAPPAATGR